MKAETVAMPNFTNAPIADEYAVFDTNYGQIKIRLYGSKAPITVKNFDYLVKKGVPFRDAHGIVGQLVLTCIEKGIALDDLTLDEYKAISPVFEQDIYDAISLKTCVEKRLTLGAPGPDVMKQVIEKYEEYLLND